MRLLNKNLSEAFTFPLGNIGHNFKLEIQTITEIDLYGYCSYQNLQSKDFAVLSMLTKWHCLLVALRKVCSYYIENCHFNMFFNKMFFWQSLCSNVLDTVPYSRQQIKAFWLISIFSSETMFFWMLFTHFNESLNPHFATLRFAKEKHLKFKCKMN